MFHLPVELQALVDIHDQPFVILDDGRRVVVVNRRLPRRTFGSSGPRSWALCAVTCWPTRTGRGHADRTATTVPSVRPCEPCGANLGLQLPGSRGPGAPAADSGVSIRTESGRTYVGMLIQRDAIRHHPEGTMGPPQVHMVGDAAAYRVVLDRLLAAAKDRRAGPAPG